ncbi:hypothetical protein XA68_14605 [Ophiocordyceps unilateralis]|uniref:Uncharacterized protein n=1 Tax=Ophiocordyceps unilateralis TaxID=268505 RepID=A0A2A9PLG2_OPHUN|nr:hypothetical protein XA68_14605 [Ophiocordyceps unilateralis]
MSSRSFQFACIISAVASLACAVAALIASDFFPPIPPSWDAEQTVRHYRSHEKGIQAGSVLFIMAGVLYPGLAAVISAQMRRIPGRHDAAIILQMGCGTITAYGGFILTGIVLAVANYRLDRPAEITQALNDLFWFLFMLIVPIYNLQSLTLAWVILQDTRPTPLFPRAIAYLNIVASILTMPTLGLHCVKFGPLAWNGAVTFWVAVFAYGIPIIVEVICLSRAVVAEERNVSDASPDEGKGRRA